MKRAGWRGHWRTSRQRLRHSLRWRLVALFLALAAGTTLLFVGGTQRTFAQAFTLFVKPLLADYVDRLAGEIGSPPDVQRAQSLAARLPISIHIDGPAVRWASGADVPLHEERSVVTRSTADGHRIQFGVSPELWQQRTRRGFVPVLGLLALTALAYAAVRRLLRPLDDIREGARRYEGGDFAAPIAVRRRDELGDLAAQVNAMAAGLHGMLRRQRELLLAISHELRSPLTRARLNAELLADAPERDALLRDLAAMRELIASLLESERLAAGAAALQREPSDLNTLVAGVVAAEFAGQPVVLDLAEGLPALALDRTRMQLLARNLIDNALRHGGGSDVRVGTALLAAGQASGEAASVGVGAGAGSEVVRLTVRDHGPGVEPAQLARLAEPFYRPEGARTRATGGVGLGLYLCKQVAASHGAAFALADARPGLEVRVDFPVGGLESIRLRRAT